MKRVTHIQAMKDSGEKIAMLTAYDASFAGLLEAAGVDIILIGDSVGMVVQGREDTLKVSVDELAYHTANVRRGCKKPLILTDLPFLSYNTPQQALENAGLLVKAGAAMIKIEGGEWLAETVSLLTQRGIPVCPHIGLTAQMVHTMGGFKIQGKTDAQVQQLINTALKLEAAGAHMLLLECVPLGVAEQLTHQLKIPVIGIGAGPQCDGQVLVSYDALGLGSEKPYKFVKNFMNGQTEGMLGAVQAYVQAVKQGDFPAPEHCF